MKRSIEGNVANIARDLTLGRSRTINATSVGPHFGRCAVLQRADHRRKLDAARKKRRRTRQALGLRVAPVEYDHGTIEMLITLGWLIREHCDDATKVGDAIARLLRDAYHYNGGKLR
jgi:hypothetical protein